MLTGRAEEIRSGPGESGAKSRGSSFWSCSCFLLYSICATVSIGAAIAKTNYLSLFYLLEAERTHWPRAPRVAREQKQLTFIFSMLFHARTGQQVRPGFKLSRPTRAGPGSMIGQQLTAKVGPQLLLDASAPEWD